MGQEDIHRRVHARSILRYQFLLASYVPPQGTTGGHAPSRHPEGQVWLPTRLTPLMICVENDTDKLWQAQRRPVPIVRGNPVPSVTRSTVIEAPVEKVFEFVADYRNTTRYQRQFSRFDLVGRPDYGEGLTVDARGWFKGLPIRVRLRITGFVKNKRIVSKSISGLKSAAEWEFYPEGQGTRVRFTAGYAYPVPIPTHTLKRMVESEIVRMTEDSLRELKRLLESGPSQAGSQATA